MSDDKTKKELREEIRQLEEKLDNERKHIGRFKYDVHVEVEHSLADPKRPYRVLTWYWWEPSPKQLEKGYEAGWHDGYGNVFNQVLLDDPASGDGTLRQVDHVKHFRNVKRAVAYMHKLRAAADSIHIYKQRGRALETTWKRVL